MPRYDFECKKCFTVKEIYQSFADYDRPIMCDCGQQMKRLIGLVAINGTRDSFGVGKEFFDKRTGQTIDNWKKWEKAGFRDPLTESNLAEPYKKIVKEKQRIVKSGISKSLKLEDL